MYTHNSWKYETLESEDYVEPTVGNRFLIVTNADIDESLPEDPIYRVTLRDLQGGAYISNKYHLTSKSKSTGSRFPNKYSKETLMSLGAALAGPAFHDSGKLPNPKNIIGGVVIGNVESREYTKQNGEPGTAYGIKEYFPAPADFVAEFSDIDQYFEGCDDESVNYINAEKSTEEE